MKQTKDTADGQTSQSSIKKPLLPHTDVVKYYSSPGGQLWHV